MLFGDGYTKYQPEMTFLDLFRAKDVFLWRTTSKAPDHQSAAELTPATVGIQIKMKNNNKRQR